MTRSFCGTSDRLRAMREKAHHLLQRELGHSKTDSAVSHSRWRIQSKRDRRHQCHQYPHASGCSMRC